jgi:hypothetical protein
MTITNIEKKIFLNKIKWIKDCNIYINVILILYIIRTHINFNVMYNIVQNNVTL